MQGAIPKKDHPGDIFPGQDAINERSPDYPHEQPGKKKHGKGLDRPVDDHGKSKTGFGALTALTTSLKSIWTMIGYIMAKVKALPEYLPGPRRENLKKPAALGKAAPRPIPIRIQRATQRVRYLWKKLNAYSFVCSNFSPH